MKRHVRIPHSKKIRELVRLQRKTKRTAAEEARHMHLFCWLTARGEGPAFDARDIVADSKRDYRILNQRALLIHLRRSRKWKSASFVQALGRSKRAFYQHDLRTYFAPPGRLPYPYEAPSPTGRNPQGFALQWPQQRVFNEGAQAIDIVAASAILAAARRASIRDLAKSSRFAF